MTFALSKGDLARLDCLHPDLKKVVLEAARITTIPFTIGETQRSMAQQLKNIAKGVSWTKRSRHIKAPDGRVYAADIIPLVSGQKSWDWGVYYKLAPIIQQAAKNVGVIVEWGGKWIKTPDGPHWQLPWATYPGTKK